MENLNTFNKFMNFYKVIEKYKFLLILIVIIFIILIVIVITFITIKIFEMSLDRMVFFYDYNKLCKKILKKYGDCEINKIYLVRRSLSTIYIFLLNLITLFQYDEMVNQSEENFPYHTMILIEVKLENNKIKWLLLEKNNCITMNDNFILTRGMEVEQVMMNKKKYNKKEKKIYLKSFLEETRNRMGNEKFFNWHLFENNCHEFTKQLLITIEKYDDYHKKIIFSDKMFELLKFPEFVYCGFNCLCIFYIFLEKYIFEMDLFN